MRTHPFKLFHFLLLPLLTVCFSLPAQAQNNAVGSDVEPPTSEDLLDYSALRYFVWSEVHFPAFLPPNYPESVPDGDNNDYVVWRPSLTRASVTIHGGVEITPFSPLAVWKHIDLWRDYFPKFMPPNVSDTEALDPETSAAVQAVKLKLGSTTSHSGVEVVWDEVQEDTALLELFQRDGVSSLSELKGRWARGIGLGAQAYQAELIQFENDVLRNEMWLGIPPDVTNIPQADYIVQDPQGGEVKKIRDLDLPVNMFAVHRMVWADSVVSFKIRGAEVQDRVAKKRFGVRLEKLIEEDGQVYTAMARYRLQEIDGEANLVRESVVFHFNSMRPKQAPTFDEPSDRDFTIVVRGVDGIERQYAGRYAPFIPTNCGECHRSQSPFRELIPPIEADWPLTRSDSRFLQALSSRLFGVGLPRERTLRRQVLASLGDHIEALPEEAIPEIEVESIKVKAADVQAFLERYGYLLERIQGR